LPRIALALLLFALLPTSTSAQMAGEDWVVEKRTTRHAEACERLEIVNRFGNVSVRVVPEAMVEVIEALQRHRDDPRRARLVFEAQDGAVRAAVEIDTSETLPEKLPDAWRKRRVDLSVYIPPGCELSVETLHGDVKARGLRAPARARSVSGSIRLQTGSRATASSDHGPVTVIFQKAVFQTADWPGTLEISSQTGDVEVQLPVGAELEARLETAGEIATDYSLEVDWAPGSLRKSARAVLGSGGRGLELSSERGAVKLLRNDSDFLAESLETHENPPPADETPNE